MQVNVLLTTSLHTAEAGHGGNRQLLCSAGPSGQACFQGLQQRQLLSCQEGAGTVQHHGPHGSRQSVTTDHMRACPFRPAIVCNSHVHYSCITHVGNVARYKVASMFVVSAHGKLRVVSYKRAVPQ